MVVFPYDLIPFHCFDIFIFRERQALVLLSCCGVLQIKCVVALFFVNCDVVRSEPNAEGIIRISSILCRFLFMFS